MSGNNNDSINFDARNRVVSDVINRSYTQSPLSELKGRIKAIKDQIATVDEEDLVGQILFARNWTMTQFKDKFKGNVQFMKHVTQDYAKQGHNKTVREYFVHIPELTGMLPYPNLETIKREYISSSASTAENAGEEYEKQLRIVSMYPRFFQAADNQLSWRAQSIGNYCKVKFVAQPGSTRVMGVFAGSINVESVDFSD